MPEQKVTRRLAAILAADMVGYSRLVGQDEEGTLARLKALREELIDPNIASHDGRIVKTMGDGILVEFASVVDAVRSAVEVQLAMAAREGEATGDRRIAFRVGVNLGDIVIDGDDILGDGVNVAARLEGLAEPGGIFVSGDVYRQVRGKLDLAFEDLGEKEMKNIQRPVHVYRVRLDGDGTATEPGMASEGAALALPDKPSIAVLPFANMSDDPEQEYFADGMVEEIITALSRIDWLFVIARNSSFTYKGRAVDVRQVARELGVRYVLEGSVRKAARRVRITGQLIDAASGAHIWADRFDGDLEDIFDLQDRITETVIGAIEPKLRKVETERSRRKRPENLDAYDLYLQALPYLNIFRPDENTEALALLEKSVALDPAYAPALACAAWCYEQRLVHKWPTALPTDAETAVRLARAALALDSDDASAVAMAGFVLAVVGGDYESGLAAAQRALDLNPNSAAVCWTAGWTNIFAGHAAAVLPVFERAMRLSPADTQAYFVLNGIAMIHLLAGRFAEAAEVASRAASLYADSDVTYWALAPALGYLGRADEARKAVAKLRSLAPGATVSGFREQLPFRDQTQLETLLEGFRKAGLPEAPPLALPDKPSIAVLPFANMSGDPEQEYFSDGISEDIITELSRLRWLFVISRNSSFTYRGKAVEVKRVAGELGVRYVLEGSVRKAGNRVRITAQLIDAPADRHVWAQRYDRDLEDIFALQDEIASQIVATVNVEIGDTEQERVSRRRPESLDAWELYQRGMWHLWRLGKQDREEAGNFFGKAIELAPTFSSSHAGMAMLGCLDVILGTAESIPQILAEALQTAEKAVELDDRDAYARYVLGRTHGLLGNRDAAIAESEKAVRLSPSFALAHYGLGYNLLWFGRSAEAIPAFDTAIRLSPNDPVLWAFHTMKGLGHFHLGDHAAAEASARMALREGPKELWPHFGLASALAEQDRTEEARAVLTDLARIKPDLSVSTVYDMLPHMDGGFWQRMVAALRKAGLPE